MKFPTRRSWALAALGVLTLLAAIQLVPYGRHHVNPPTVSEPAWDSPVTRELARQACFDCHSNETTWPTYARVAPLSGGGRGYDRPVTSGQEPIRVLRVIARLNVGGPALHAHPHAGPHGRVDAERPPRR